MSTLDVFDSRIRRSNLIRSREMRWEAQGGGCGEEDAGRRRRTQALQEEWERRQNSF
jgi:hypothetical protein